MEYAAVFLLFSVTAAAAIRVCISGKGLAVLAYLVLTALSLCPEQAGKNVGFPPALLLAVCAGAAYIGYKKDFQAIACALVVAAVAACVPLSAGADIRGLAYICSAAFCALLLKPFGAGGAFVVGYVLGDTYSLFADSGVIFRYDLFSLDIVYAAMFCVTAAALVNALSDVARSAKLRTGTFLPRLLRG